jgi:hypothetical protein
MAKARKTIPAFKDEDAERDFWSKEDSTEYIDWSKAQRVPLPNLRPTLRTGASQTRDRARKRGE